MENTNEKTREMFRLMSVYETATSITMTDEAKNAIKAAIREQCSLNRVIKDMKSAAIYKHIAPILAKVGIDEQKDITITKVKSLIASDFFKEVNDKETGKKRCEICIIRKVYLTEEVKLAKDGKILVDKDGKERVQKVPVFDEYGERLVKEYKLCVIKTWSIPLLLTVLAQSQKIREGLGD